MPRMLSKAGSSTLSQQQNWALGLCCRAFHAVRIQLALTSNNGGKTIDAQLKVVWMMSQVQVGLWVRNGPEVGQVHRLYQGAYWNEASYDLDMLLLQLWMARSDADQ